MVPLLKTGSPRAAGRPCHPRLNGSDKRDRLAGGGHLLDFVDALPEIVKAAAGLPLQFRLDVTLGASVRDVKSSTLASIDALLRGVSPDLGLKR